MQLHVPLYLQKIFANDIKVIIPFMQMYIIYITDVVLSLIEHMKKILKNAIFWQRSSIAPYINIMRIREKLISYVKLDHTFC